mgnify:CR=1
MFNNSATNGIKHNGERVSDITLINGIELEIGDVLFIFTFRTKSATPLLEAALSKRLR